VHPIAAVQSEYSLCSPLGRGFLTGGVVPASLGETDSRRAHPRFQRDNATANQRLAAKVGAAARNLGVLDYAVLAELEPLAQQVSADRNGALQITAHQEVRP